MALTRQAWIQLPEDGLSVLWGGLVFCNPPYSAPLAWCARLAGYDLPWVALVKLDTSTAWWRVLLSAGADWAPLRSRLRFEPPPVSRRVLATSAVR